MVDHDGMDKGLFGGSKESVFAFFFSFVSSCSALLVYQASGDLDCMQAS